MIYRALAILMMAVFFPFVGLVLIVYSGFCFYVFKAFKWLKFDNVSNHTTGNGISIVVPCRNEASNILQCIDAIAQQKEVHFPYELIIVDDHSEDDSRQVVSKYQANFDMLCITSSGTGKKAALLSGIQAAKYPVIYTIDADCRMGDQCLTSMHQLYTQGDLMMLCGLVSYEAKNIFGSLQQAESVALVGISAFMLNSGRPATCNGANLMFSKAMFEHVGGYGQDKALSSGDDDLLMQSFATYQPHKVRYASQPQAVVYTAAENSIKSFVSQRMRWTSKRRSYKYYYNTFLML
ncbi:MAG: glycosyltransferase, partial [Chitinophagaceae bacterium]